MPATASRSPSPRTAVASRQRAHAVLHPLSCAIAALLLAGGVTGTASAQQAFSPAWFANKGAIQGGATATGLLPNGLPANTLTAPQQQSQAAREKLQQSLANLNTAAQAIALQQALQQQARQAALLRPSDIPDGLGEGGLKIDENELTSGWHNAKDPTQSVAGGKTTVTIEQTGDKAILNWETFNVGRNTTVDFEQEASWAVLNRVNDPKARPSQIQGQINADGTVLLINRNGVVFDGSSQVNVRNLAVAAAEISDAQFRDNGLYGANNAASLTDASGAIKVEAGALIRTHEPQSVTQGGGYVMLLGTEVANAGEIVTRKGQALLAAGDDFIIRKGVGTEGNQHSTTRGNEVVALRKTDGSIDDSGDPLTNPSGTVANTGLILAREGDVTLTGHDVRQQGVAVATTTVNTRGTVHLLNSAGDADGRVVLGADATTAVLIEDDGKTTALDAQRDALIAESAAMDAQRMQAASGSFDNYSQLSDRRDQSRIEIVSGGDVVFEGDSLTLATGGQVAVSSGGRAFVADRAQLDVSGAVGVQVAMESNTVRVNVQGNELRDSPHNRDSGALFNNNVWVDRRDLILVPAGTGGYTSDRWYAAGGLLEVGGWLSNQGHSIGEWAAQGGTVTLAGHEVVTQVGSKVNIAGGTLDVQTGYVQQSWLRGVDGRIHSLQDAPADLTYAGVYTGYALDHARWGVQDNYVNPIIAPQRRLENGYTVGRDAGTLIVDAPTAVLEGDIVADVFDGARQTRDRDALHDGYRQAQTAVARAGGLTVARVNARGFDVPHASPIVVGAFDDVTGTMTDADAMLPEERIGSVRLDAERLNRTGLGSLTLLSGDSVRIDEALTLADGGALELKAPEVAIDADVTIRSGSISAGNRMPVATIAGIDDTPLLRDGTAEFNLGTGATVDLTGVWRNGLIDGDESPSLAHIDGGDLSVRVVHGSVRLAEGSLMDLSSGAALRADGRLVGGRGGNLTLVADEASVDGDGGVRLGTELVLDGEIRAKGVAGGGTLTLQSPTPVVFGENAVLESGVLEAGMELPADVVLAEAITLQAGSQVPFEVSVEYSHLQAGVSAPTSIGMAGTVVLAADWTVPTGIFRVRVNDSVNVFPGAVVPAGSTVVIQGSIPQGMILSADAFPDGISTNPYLVAVKAGDITPTDIAVDAGRILTRGMRFDQPIRFAPAMNLSADLLKSGFSQYDITSRTGLLVAPEVELAVETPVLRLPPDGFSAPSGTPAGSVLESWLPPVFLENPQSARLDQRAGAELSLYGTSLEVGQGARIAVDPGRSIRLAAAHQLTVDGAIVAPGGDITLLTESLTGQRPASEANLPGASIWIGGNALIDAAGQGWTALDASGRRYGVAQDGGSIRIGLSDYDGVDGDDLLDASRAAVVIREGAVLEASGAAAVVEVGEGMPASSRPVQLAGDGGLVQIGSLTAIVNDGTLRAAAGGEGAAGGRLNLVLENDRLAHRAVRTLTLTQERAASGLEDDAAPGGILPESLMGNARISVEEIEAGGFGSLDLWSRDVIEFDGNVDLSMRESLALRRGLLSVSETTPQARVALSAPHVLLAGKVAQIGGPGEDIEGAPPAGLIGPGGAYQDYAPSSRNEARLDITADLVDVTDDVFFGGLGSAYLPDANGQLAIGAVDRFGFDHVGISSRGDIRFTDGLLSTAADMTLTASQIYPTTHAKGEIYAGVIDLNQDLFDPERWLRIRSNGTTPDLPFSVFGQLHLRAPTIDQGGVLRAPLGRVVLGSDPDLNAIGGSGLYLYEVLLRAGSLTSTSAAGLRLPYGGTSDGLSYFHDGTEVSFRDLAEVSGTGNARVELGVVAGQARLTAEAGSVIDVSGGGELTGAGFVTGRGGSVDVLRTPLASANPAHAFSSPDAEVYAIVPSMQGGYAPVSPDAGAGAPRLGQQITITEGLPGLPAGTYTLMPSTYALLPGAFRVELGGTARQDVAALQVPSGMFRASGHLGIANTGVRDALPTQLTLMPADTVRRFSQYNETGYTAFALANAARFGAPAPRLERDAQNLHLDFGGWEGDVLDFQGEVRMAGAEDGAAGNLFLTAFGPLEIKTATAEATEGFTSVDSEDLARIEAGVLTVGGIFSLGQGLAAPGLGGYELGPRVVFHSGESEVAVREGAQLRADQIFLTSRDRVSVDGGALIEAIASDGRAIDSAHGYIFSDTLDLQGSMGGAIVGVSSGEVRFTPPTIPQGDATGVPLNAISIADDAILRAPGSLLFSTNGALDIGEAELNARYLTLTSPGIHVGTAESFARADAAGVLGAGVRLSQTLLDRLVRPTAPGQTPIERLTLSAGSSINLLGGVDIDLGRATGDADTQLLLETPALYGWGEDGEAARIAAGTVIWSGVSSGAGGPTSPFVSVQPGAVIGGGPGTGSGALTIDATRIELGYAPYAQPQDQTQLDRLALGFSTVNLLASERITANHRGTLSVYASGVDTDSYAGGDLNLVTPVLTGGEGSFAQYRAGGAVTLTALEGTAIPDLSTFDTLGAEVRLAGESVRVDTAVALPSGRLVLEADNGIALTERAAIDLAGRTLTYFDVTKHSWGGDLVMETTDGAIVQAAGSVIDVSASGNDAGTIQATAAGTDGAVAFAGTLRGKAAEGLASGAIDIRARTLADFTVLNERLNAGGFFEARSFVVGTGDLVIGDEVQARQVTISADGGSLTVNGRIDASGAKPGEIRLGARDDLVLASSAVLDARSTQLQVDGRGAAIDASNRGRVELTSAEGSVVLGQGATIDLRSADAIARGRLDINAPRIGNDNVAVDAAGSVIVRGADSIAVNAFRRYAPEDGHINQGYMDLIHSDSTAFIDAALGNDTVSARLAGLSAYGEDFHLRPGVEIRSATPDGDLVIDGDIDLSGYRYGPGADPALRGSGEPGVVTIRAGGDLRVEGSLTDGFAPPPVTPDDDSFVPGGTAVIPAGTSRPDEWLLEADLTILEDWVVPDTPYYQDFWGYVYDTSWNYYGPGELVPAGTILAAWGAVFEANQPLPSYLGEAPAIPGRVWAAASMLAPGMQSWSMRLVSGADLASADHRTLAAASRLTDSGDLVLEAVGRIGPQGDLSPISVIRTGTGDLELLAGGDYLQKSLFGVYTAGTQVADAGAWDVERARLSDGTVLGWGNEGYEATLDARRMYMTTGGGDLRLTAQGDIRGYLEHAAGELQTSADIGKWLWRQGGEGLDQPTAWGVNFGQYVWNSSSQLLEFAGFSGIGVLGGGNVTVTAGGDVGSTANTIEFDDRTMTDGLAVVVGTSGSIDASGDLSQGGGGDLVLNVGGRINTGLSERRANQDSSGVIVNLRGQVDIRAGAIGQALATGYGVNQDGDPRPVDITAPSNLIAYSPLVVSLGDAQAQLVARGTLTVASGQDPGRVALIGAETQSGDATGVTAFSLWTDRSGLDLFSAGGDVAWSSNRPAGSGNPSYSPGRFAAIAAGGSVVIRDELILAPSRQGVLELLARDHLLGDTLGRVAMSGAAQDGVATPSEPLWVSNGPEGRVTNGFADSGHLDGSLYDLFGAALFAFGPNTAGNLAMDSSDPIRFYALAGDINLGSGRAYNNPAGTETYWIASRPTHMRAGRDIVASSHLMLNRGENDISVVRAGRDILNSSIRIAGPGLLDVAAGRNIYQAYNFGGSAFQEPNLSVIQSVGPLVPGDTRPGVDIMLSAGLGTDGVDLNGFAARYLDPANLADTERPLADQPGKVVRTYERELLDWLRERYGYEGGQDDALARFDTLSAEERGIFLRSVYFEELRLAGREYTDPDSRRFGSYLRGREAIASFLPGVGEGDEQGAYQGSITFLETAGAHTYAGGDIQVLAPGGGLTLGADGVVPPATTGLLTQGRGDIEVFTRDSVRLGLSRVFTTFGGGITMWSAQGDINAGRGAKTSVVYTPPRRVYDDVGNVTLSPQVPSTGAGIATLNPIPEVPAGDVDLIAPQGTIDAGEAGIRVSGNVNLAALQVVNAENIQAQGDATGLPTVAAVNVAALATASTAANSASQAAQEVVRRQTQQSRPSIINVQVLGFGDRTSSRAAPAKPAIVASAQHAGYNSGSAFQVLGDGELGEAQRGRLTTAERNNLDRQ